MGRFFLFREVNPGETSPVTWGFEEAKVYKVKFKVSSSQVTTKIRTSS
jgi:hypothetical protein